MDKSMIEKTVGVFKTPQDFNWAWEFYSAEVGDWV